jgi:hypothetical protein
MKNSITLDQAHYANANSYVLICEQEPQSFFLKQKLKISDAKFHYFYNTNKSIKMDYYV